LISFQGAGTAPIRCWLGFLFVVFAHEGYSYIHNPDVFVKKNSHWCMPDMIPWMVEFPEEALPGIRIQPLEKENQMRRYK